MNKKKLILLVLSVIVLSLAFKNPVMRLRLAYEKKFSLCKENAKLIEGHGYFNLCTEKDYSGGFPAGIHTQFIVYDSNDMTAQEYCKKFNLTEILKKNFHKDMQQHITSIKKLSANFYSLSYSSDYAHLKECLN